MRYVIWGAGERGKKACQMLGEESVTGFIDISEEKQKIGFLGKRVEKPVQVLPHITDEIIIITPDNKEDEIADYLEMQGIHRYLRMDACPLEAITEEKNLLELCDFSDIQGKVALYGITVFTFTLYAYLLNYTNCEPYIIAQDNINFGILQAVKSEYKVKDLNEALGEETEFILMCKDAEIDYAQKGGAHVSAFEISDFLIKHISYVNKEITKFKGIHTGKRCFIIATGPSLKIEDLDTLHAHHEICISMNRIYNLFRQTEWRPDYYMIEDAKMIEDLADDISGLDLPCKFVASNPECYWQKEAAATSLKFQQLIQDYEDAPEFSECCERYIFNGRTVTYECMQMAVYMGFSEIYLLGVDFNYSNDIYAEENHFPGYQNPNKMVRLNTVYPDKVKQAYEKAKEYADNHGIKIYNATRGGKLEVFERKSFDELVIALEDNEANEANVNLIEANEDN